MVEIRFDASEEAFKKEDFSNILNIIGMVADDSQENQEVLCKSDAPLASEISR